MKVCRDCGLIKNLTDYYKTSPRCKECHNTKSAQWAKDNPNRIKLIRRKTKLKERYGISPGDYDHMFDEQGGLCKLCLHAHPRRPLNVDHCHKTGKVRGLLCDKCNLGIGLFDDNPDLINKVKEYLSENPFD